MYLFFDTETTGLPKDYRAPVEDVDNWPRIVQLAWALFDDNEYLVGSECHIIRQIKAIPDEAIKTHGITNSMASLYGIQLREVMTPFEWACHHERTKYIIAHNIHFDRKVFGAEFVRYDSKIPFDHLTRICTMTTSTKFCGLKQKNGKTPKWPSLEELYYQLFQETLENQHNAMVDVLATAKCFFELKKLGVIDLEKIKENHGR
jgi:DNA polymerase III epsilon subunit-like protein